ncbi:MAG: hypothetical protein ACRDGH_11680, partial [Candidatus Limnocylindria bacterium]
MRPQIQRYLAEHGAAYTPEALRHGLLAAGYDPVEVDAALREWEARATDPDSAATHRRRFWRWAFGLHAAVLVVIGVLSLLTGSFATGSWGLLIILAVVLLIGLGISGMVGRGVLRGSGLSAALVVPAISALLIGGSCLAVGGSYLLRAPPRTGLMELQIEPPLSFEGSGVAHCDNFGGTSGFLVWTEELGTLDGRVVSVSLDASTQGVAQGQGPEVTGLSISLNPQTETEPAVGYSIIFSTRVELD